MAKNITKYIRFNGPFFFQAKEDKNGEPRLIEINARISGTMSLSSASGVNLHKLSIQLAMEEKIKIPKINSNLYVSRYWTDLVLSKKDFIKNKKG